MATRGTCVGLGGRTNVNYLLYAGKPFVPLCGKRKLIRAHVCPKKREYIGLTTPILGYIAARADPATESVSQSVRPTSTTAIRKLWRCIALYYTQREREREGNARLGGLVGINSLQARYSSGLELAFSFFFFFLLPLLYAPCLLCPRDVRKEVS